MADNTVMDKLPVVWSLLVDGPPRMPRQPLTAPNHSSANVGVARLSEIVAALTRALDLTEGQIPGHAVRSCLIGMRIGETIGLSDTQLSELYYALLLKDLGCSSNAARVAELFGSDDHGVKRALKTIDWTRVLPAARYGLENAAIGQGIAKRIYHFVRVGVGGQRVARSLIKVRCEQGSAIARRMGFSDATADAIRGLDEHWDGNGHPDGLNGQEIPILARIAGIAQTAEVFVTAHGRKSMLQMLRERRGTWFDPHLVDAVNEFREDEMWWRAIRSADSERLVVSAEPDVDAIHVNETVLDRVAEAFADVIDAKSPYTARHSCGVAHYAREIGHRLRLDEQRIRNLYRAGLVHDIGKLGVSSRILDKPGKLTEPERAAIEQHPRFTWHILSRVSVFRDFAWNSALHHEKIDGSGYPWGLAQDSLEMEARILAVADVFEALTADRPYRAGMDVERALGILCEGEGIHFDADAVQAMTVVKPISG